MNSYYDTQGGTYHEENGYLIPDLEPPETPQIGVWGRRYLHHLKTTIRTQYTELMFSGTLAVHLEETERCAKEILERLMVLMAAHEGVTEQLKAENQMEWVRRMNSIRSRAEEIVWDELTT